MFNFALSPQKYCSCNIPLFNILNGTMEIYIFIFLFIPDVHYIYILVGDVTIRLSINCFLLCPLDICNSIVFNVFSALITIKYHFSLLNCGWVGECGLGCIFRLRIKKYIFKFSFSLI